MIPRDHHTLRRLILILLLAASAKSGAAQSLPARGAGVETTAQTDRASCVLMVTGNGGYRNHDLQIDTVNATLTSTSFVDPLISETLHLDGATWPQVVSFEITPAGQNAVRLAVIVKPRPGLPPSPAHLLLGAMASRLGKIYTVDDENQKQAVAQQTAAQNRVQSLNQQLIELRAKLAQMPSPYQSGFGMNGIPFPQLQRELDEKTARLTTLNQAVEQLSAARKPLIAAAEATAKSKSDFATALATQAKPGDVSAALEVSRAKADADEAAQRAAELSIAPLADPQSPLFNNALQLNMDIAALQVDLKRANGSTTQPAQNAAEYDKTTAQMQETQSELESTRMELNRLEQQAQNSSSIGRVVVLGTKDASQ